MCFGKIARLTRRRGEGASDLSGGNEINLKNATRDPIVDRSEKRREKKNERSSKSAKYADRANPRRADVS